MKEQDYVAALKSIIGQAEMMVADIESKTPNVVERHDKEAFADEPVIKVESWYWGRQYNEASSIFNTDVFRTEYTIAGQPHWKRIIRETFGEGAEVVRVTPVKGEMLDHMGCKEAVEILSKYCIKHGTIQRVKSSVYPYWFTWKYITDADIEAAIREHYKADEPKPKFEVGQWVYSTTNILKHQPCKVIGYTGGHVKVETQDGQRFVWAEHSLRPAVPSDFDVTVGNMKVRAYDTSFGCLMMKSTGGISGYYNVYACTSIVPAGLRALGIPIIPLSVSGGKFEAPKGE